jgi:hypothetical protein
MLTLLVALLASPALTAPPNDPDFAHCIEPHRAVELHWDAEDDGTQSFLLIKRRTEDGGWRTWVKSYVRNPPFRLNMKGKRARNGDYAWMIFGVDRAKGEYAIGDWHYFCTRD